MAGCNASQEIVERGDEREIFRLVSRALSGVIDRAPRPFAVLRPELVAAARRTLSLIMIICQRKAWRDQVSYPV